MNDVTTSHHPDALRKTSPVLIACAWLFVGIPLAWGVAQTAIKSMDLFRAPQAQIGVGASPAPAPTTPNAPAQPTRSP